MPLTPSVTDENRKPELERRQRDSDSFGVNNRRSEEVAKKIEQNNNQGNGPRNQR